MQKICSGTVVWTSRWAKWDPLMGCLKVGYAIAKWDIVIYTTRYTSNNAAIYIYSKCTGWLCYFFKEMLASISRKGFHHPCSRPKSWGGQYLFYLCEEFLGGTSGVLMKLKPDVWCHGLPVVPKLEASESNLVNMMALCAKESTIDNGPENIMKFHENSLLKRSPLPSDRVTWKLIWALSWKRSPMKLHITRFLDRLWCLNDNSLRWSMVTTFFWLFRMVPDIKTALSKLWSPCFKPNSLRYFERV